MNNIDRLRSVGIVAVLRGPTSASTLGAARALIAGGVLGIEVTYSTPDAASVIRVLRDEVGPEVLLGAGTLLTVEHVGESVDAGADFLVSPGNDPEVTDAMVRTDATICIGAFTATEVMSAMSAGAHVAKVFPASLGGPSYLKSLRAPLPHAPLMPTGGVDHLNLAQWFHAGAIAVGAGGELCPPALMAAGETGEIERRARVFSSALESYRQEAA